MRYIVSFTRFWYDFIIGDDLDDRRLHCSRSWSDVLARSFEHASLVGAAAGRNCHVRSQSLA
jgi:hypothetical protein